MMAAVPHYLSKDDPSRCVHGESVREYCQRCHHAHIFGMEPFQKITRNRAERRQDERELIEDALKVPGVTRAAASAAAREVLAAEMYVNHDYCVHVFDEGELLHLSIKRHDREPMHDWRVLQTIKNLIVGPDHDGVELYPAESRLVDTSNQYHLYVCKDAKARFGFGYRERNVLAPIDGTKFKQRAFGKETR